MKINFNRLLASITSSTKLFIRTLIVVLMMVQLLACGGSGVGGNQVADPVTQDFAIIYLKKNFVSDTSGAQAYNTTNQLDLFAFNPLSLAEIIIKPRANVDAPETEILRPFIASTFGAEVQFDAKDLTINFAATKLAFSLRVLTPAEQTLEPADQPGWNIWLYDLASQSFEPALSGELSGDFSEQGNDISPAFLADDSIVFASDRQERTQAIQLDEGKGQYKVQAEALLPGELESRDAVNLFIVDPSASRPELKQITFSRTFDFDPVLMPNGKIVFSRWDATFGQDRGVSYYQMDHSGGQLERFYGFHSHDYSVTNGASSLQFTNAIPMPMNESGEQRLAALLRPYTSQYQGSDIVFIDVENYVEHDVPVAAPSSSAAQASQAFIAQTPATGLTITADDVPGVDGKFSAVYPLFDGSKRLLVSWAYCELATPSGDQLCTADDLNGAAVTPGSPSYGVYIYDYEKQTQNFITAPEKGVYYTDLLAAQPIPLPAVDNGYDFSLALAQRNSGVLHIRSIYDIDGAFVSPDGRAPNASFEDYTNPSQFPMDDRPIRFLRFMKKVAFPNEETLSANDRNRAIGPNDANVAGQMWELLGYAPVMPDGSVRVMLPAGVPFTFFYVDGDGEEINAGSGSAINSGQEHFTWLELLPGEEKQCNGCHEGSVNQAGHGRSNGIASINNGAPFDNIDNAPQALLNSLDSCAGVINSAPCEDDSMAALYSKADSDRLGKVLGLFYDDIFTASSKYPSINISYKDLNSRSPSRGSCVDEWDGLCRSVINYEEHIQALWDIERTDVNDAVVSCVGCHSREQNGVSQEPQGSLELTGELNEADDDYSVSHFELVQRGGRDCSVNSLTNLVSNVARRRANNEFVSPASASIFNFNAPVPDGEVAAADTDAVSRPLLTVTDGIIEQRDCECVHPAVNSNSCEIYDDNSDGFSVVNINPGIVYELDLDSNPATPEVEFSFDSIYGFDSGNRAIVGWVGNDPRFLNPLSGELVVGFDLGGNAILAEELDGRTIIAYANGAPVYGQDRLAISHYTDRRAIAFDTVFPDDFTFGNRFAQGNANANEGFLSMMQSDTYQSVDAPEAYDHSGLLNAAELLLLREWFDVGMQYYNNPFHPALQAEN